MSDQLDDIFNKEVDEKTLNNFITELSMLSMKWTPFSYLQDTFVFTISFIYYIFLQLIESIKLLTIYVLRIMLMYVIKST